MSQKGSYYLPSPSHWPLCACIAVFCMLCGAAHWLHHEAFGPYLTGFGFLLVLVVMFGWFSTVVKEHRQGLLHDSQVNKSFRLGMGWFIFSEVALFATFFGTLFYARLLSVPWLGGHGSHSMTNIVLWPNFESVWPLFKNPNPTAFVGAQSVMETWGIPALNTLILLTSGATITVAHFAIINNERRKAIIAQALTAGLGIIFLCMQVHEYIIAYTEKGLKLSSGIFGSTFFILTGFHAFHVTVGTICLLVILYRIIKRDFSKEHHFAFEAVAWYWHMVDVVWLFLFIFVYWI